MIELTFISCLGVNIEDIVVLPIRIFSCVSIVDVDVDSVGTIETLSCRTLRGMGYYGP